MTDTLTVKEMAEKCGASPSAVYRLVKSGRLPSVRVGPRTIRIPADAADTFLRKEPISHSDIDEAVKTATGAEATARVLLRQLVQDRDDLTEQARTYKKELRAIAQQHKQELRRLREDAERLLVKAARETGATRPPPPVKASPEPELLTMVEAAEWLDMSKRTVQKLVTSGDLPAVRVSGRIVRIRPEDLDAFVEGRVVSKKTVRR